MKRELVFLIVIVFFIKPAFGASLEDLVGAELAAVLRSATEPVSEVQQKNPHARLLPQHEELTALVSEIQDSLDPNVFVEALYLYHKPADANWSEAEQINLLNQLAALSTLAGIEYYSETRKAMRVFYETSSVIDSPAGKKPLPDPVYDTLPDSFVLYARQKDLTFGDNIYRYDYYTSTDAIFLVQENLTAMTAGIIRAISRNRLRSLIAVIDAGDCLLIYTAAMARVTSLAGMGDRIGTSFTNRAKAILKWFDGCIGRVF